MNKLVFTCLFVLLAAFNLAAQSSYTVTKGKTQTYQINKQANIVTYQWTVFTNTNLTATASSTDVTLASLGVGRENEIEVTWNSEGTYYLTISVTDNEDCSNKIAFVFNVVLNNPPDLVEDTNSTIEKLAVAETDGSGNILANDTDAEDDALSIVSINSDLTGNVAGVYGTLVWNSDGTYTYTPNSTMDTLAVGESVKEIFAVRVTDGHEGGEVLSTLIITINGANQNPIANNDTNSTIETEFITELDGSGNLLLNDTDVDGDVLHVNSVNGNTSGVFTGVYGTINWNPDGTYSYTPNADLDSLKGGETVIETLNVAVADGNGGLSVSTLTITINGFDSNDKPDAVADRVTVDEDILNFEIDVLANDIDPDGNPLIVSILSSPVSGGRVSIVGNAVSYSPPTNFNGNDFFVYQICDNGVPSLCDNDTVFIQVNQVNDAPVAETDNLSVFKNNQSTIINVLANDTDADGDQLTVSILNQPTSGGVATVSGDQVIYDYPDDFLGTDYIIYQLCDNGSPVLCDADTIIINVTNQVLAVDDEFTIYADATQTFDVTGNDFFDGSVTVSVISSPKHGKYVVNSDNTIQFTADKDFFGSDSFEYIITNTTGSDIATVTITINPHVLLSTNTYCVDEIPYLSWSVQIVGSTSKTIDLRLTDSTGKLIEFIENAMLSGSMEWPGNKTVGDAFFAVPSVMETISIKAEFISETVVEIVGSTLIVPDCHLNKIVANPDFADVYSEEIKLYVLNNDFDADEGDIDPSSVTIENDHLNSGPYHGDVFVKTDGTINYIPDPGYTGKDSFIYSVCDNYVLKACDTAMVRLNLYFNDHLIANNDYYNLYADQTKEYNLAANDFDPDGALDLSSLIITYDPENGNVISNGDGTVTYQPLPNFEGRDSFMYTICDNGIPQECDSAWGFINVHENVEVVAVRDDASTFVQEEVVLFVLDNDYDYEGEIDSTSLKITNLPTNGKVELLDDWTVKYTPNDKFAGIDSFIYSLCDYGYPVTCDTAIVYVEVKDNNIAVVANPDNVFVPENEAVSIQILKNDYDSDGTIDLSSIEIVSDEKHGEATVNADGTLTYQPDRDFVGTDSIIYRICDNGPIVSCDTALVVLHILNNMPPVAVNDTIDAVLSSITNYLVAINDFDSEGQLDTLSVVLVDMAKKGVVGIDSLTGEITYKPSECAFGVDSFTYRISDIEGNESNMATVYFNLVIDPLMDSDNDLVPDIAEDLNKNGNLCDDDTDLDGIPNYLEVEDDGDGVLTSIELGAIPMVPIDTDGDKIPDYLDVDDDNDCMLTKQEDFNKDGDYQNDDIDEDGIPNYLDDDDDGDSVLSCDENGDLDQNGIPDRFEVWNSKALDDYISIGVDEVADIPVLNNDSTHMDGSSVYILTEPTKGIVNINTSDYSLTYEPQLNFIGEDSFQYVVCDYIGLCDTATVYIYVRDVLVVPQLFTPNGDGDNDYFEILGLERYSNNHFLVYNRWGNVVYEITNYKNDWNGFSNVKFVIGDRELPVGTYYYILDYGVDRQKVGALFLER